MRDSVYPVRNDRSEDRESLGLTRVPLDRQISPDHCRPHHPLVSNRRAELSGALRAEMRELRNRSHDAEIAKSTILANLSHEFRTPLNAIIGFSELLLSDAAGKVENERQQEYIGDIHNSAVHLLGMVQGLLDTADLTNGLADLHREATDLVQIFSGAYDTLAPFPRARNVNLELDADCGSCAAQIDSERFSNAIRQVLVQSIRRAPPRSTILVGFNSTPDAVTVSISCSTGRNAEEGGTAPDSSFARPPHGLLGNVDIDSDLSIARLVIELHGGTLRLSEHPEAALLTEIEIPRRAD